MKKIANKKLTVAIDAMGGDNAPEMIIDGSALAAVKHPDLSFRIFGKKNKIEGLIKKHPALNGRYELINCDEVITMDMQPSVALRRGRNSSMRKAIDDVEAKRSDFCVSAGNTGALMVIAFVVLRTLQDIDRPAICAEFPTVGGNRVYMLDLGANVECGVVNYIEFAVMGSLFCSIMSGIKSPRVGLLNIGVEEVKGKDEIRLAARTLEQLGDHINYTGFVEPDGLMHDFADLVVTDGFTGNVTLKTIEGTLRFFSKELSSNLKSSMLGRVGGLISKPAYSRFKSRIDPREYNGATLLGLNGIVIKSHGGTDDVGFAYAIGSGVILARHDYVQLLDAKLEPIMTQMADSMQSPRELFKQASQADNHEKNKKNAGDSNKKDTPEQTKTSDQGGGSK